MVFERYQFWQITQKDSETVDQFVTRLKNKVQLSEYESVNDMERDKFVFSIRDSAVKERPLRDEKLTLEKAICMARASEASKEQIKAMVPKEHSNENPSLNDIRYGGTRGVLVLLLVKRVIIAREKTILLACAERNCKILAGKQCIPRLKRQTAATPELIC